MPYNEKIPVVYILAASHSGSTLLSMLLNAHQDVCSVGELKATNLGSAEQYLCSCREKITRCPFWSEISRDMAKKGYSFDITDAGTDFRTNASAYVLKMLKPLHRGPFLEKIRDVALELSPAWRKQLPAIQQRNISLMSTVLARTGKKIIADSSKIGLRLKYLLRNPALDVRIIWLVRDGRGVALTYMDPAQFADARDSNLRAGGTGGDRQTERLSMKQAANEWKRSLEEEEAIIKTVDQTRWIQIRYEELCTQTESVLTRVFTFLGVDPKKAETNYRKAEHHIVGNGMRLDSQSEIKLDERWKTALRQEHLQTFNSIAGQMNKKLGYL